jgi:hypothetical protein
VLTCGHSWGDGVNPDAVLGFLILFISYAWKVGGLFDAVCSSYQRWIRHPIQWGFEKMLTSTARRYVSTDGQSSRARLGRLLLHRIVVAVWIPYVAVFETLASFSTAIWISCLGLVFGTLQIAIPREQNQPLLGDNENTWGFGQLVPLILLIQPFSVVWEHLIVVPGKSPGEDSADRSISAATETTTSKDFEAQSSEQAQQPASLLHCLGIHEPVKPADRIQHQATPLEHLLLDSFLFHINVYLIQPAVITAATVAFDTDAYLIGYSTTGNWSWFCIVLGVYVGVAWLTTFCLLPWFAIGKEPEQWRTGRATICGNDEVHLGERHPGSATRLP